MDPSPPPPCFHTPLLLKSTSPVLDNPSLFRTTTPFSTNVPHVRNTQRSFSFRLCLSPLPLVRALCFFLEVKPRFLRSFPIPVGPLFFLFRSFVRCSQFNHTFSFHSGISKQVRATVRLQGGPKFFFILGAVPTFFFRRYFPPP